MGKYSTTIANEVLGLVEQTTGNGHDAANVYRFAAQDRAHISNGFGNEARGGRILTSFDYVPTVSR